MQIGDRLLLHPSHITGYEKIPGRVVYIHPKWRFFMVEFEGKMGNYRECFPVPRRSMKDEL